VLISVYPAAEARPAAGPASYLPASAQGYANTASSYATAGVGRARDGIDSMFTQQRREQVGIMISVSRSKLTNRSLPTWARRLQAERSCWVKGLGGWASLQPTPQASEEDLGQAVLLYQV
jgi:hypothetical protein